MYAHDAELTPFQTHCYSENLVIPGIEPRTPGSAAKNFDHQTTEAVPVMSMIHNYIWK
jgi:hypothetical protein